VATLKTFAKVADALEVPPVERLRSGATET
jgi:hypothetical protein